MTTPDDARRLVRAHLDALDTGTGPGHLSSDHVYRGVHPFDDLTGAEVVNARVWQPIRHAFGPLQRRLSILIAGHSHLDPARPVWVMAMGHVLGTSERDWLGIPPTGKLTWLPFASFLRVEHGAIVETMEFLDILAVIDQAGLNPFAAGQTAAQLMAPGPRTLDGVTATPQDPAESRATLDLCQAMLDDLTIEMRSPIDHLTRFWHPDMCWFGPTGIGACMGFEGYRRGHIGPFETGLEFIEAHPEQCALAEGSFAGFVWCPALTMRPKGGFMGLPASDSPAVMRIIDVYRRAGDRLAENWIFIDMLHFLRMQGVDLLADIATRKR